MSLTTYDPPIINSFYQADPTAHVWKCSPDKVYIYGSHDWNSSVIADDVGSKYDMKDYWVLSQRKPENPADVVAKLLDLQDVTWAQKQLWAPDVAEKDGKYYLYFPAKDYDEIFRIGVAVSDTPDGQFIPEPSYIPGSYSIDPAVLHDDDDSYHMYFGGVWGGQLQAWTDNVFNESWIGPNASTTGEALKPRYAKLSEDMKTFVAPPREVDILDKDGLPMLWNSPRRFFEGPSMNKINGLYYLSYSTGTTHTIEVAVSSSVSGPFLWNSTLLQPVEGWTTHSSLVRFKGKWWIYYGDASLSGQDNVRNTKVRELEYEGGTLRLVQPQPVAEAWVDATEVAYADDPLAKRGLVSRRHAMEFWG